ncbi:hypothetical protein EAO24_08970 [Klebsiella pneumoniae]|nr:hypothetical protein EAO24_08970 [Klebsiella pneumoniae]
MLSRFISDGDSVKHNKTAVCHIYKQRARRMLRFFSDFAKHSCIKLSYKALCLSSIFRAPPQGVEHVICTH